MKLSGLVDEDFINYKKPAMFIGFPDCSFKCDIEAGEQVCQNSTLATCEKIEFDIEKIYKRFASNPITSAVVCGGLEPFDSWNDPYVTDITLINYTAPIGVVSGAVDLGAL